MKKYTLLFLSLLLVMSLLTACGGGTAYSPYYKGAESESADLQSYNVNPSEYESYSGYTDYGEKQEPGDDLITQGEKIVYTAEISLETTQFDQSVAALENMVRDLNGYIENSEVSGNTRYGSDGTTKVVNRHAYYRIAVPSASFNEALSMTGNIGNVINKQQDAQNITAAYTDTEARLESLEVQRERILSMMETSSDIESLIVLEQRLSEIIYQIESYQRTLRDYDRRVAYSVISFTIREVEIYTPTVPVTRTFGEKLSDAFGDGWTTFTDGIKEFVLFLAEALPFLILWALIITAAVLLIRRGVRKSRIKKQKIAEQRAAQYQASLAAKQNTEQK